jgi:hypothetical protein
MTTIFMVGSYVAVEMSRRGLHCDAGSDHMLGEVRSRMGGGRRVSTALDSGAVFNQSLNRVTPMMAPSSGVNVSSYSSAPK